MTINSRLNRMSRTRSTLMVTLVAGLLAFLVVPILLAATTSFTSDEIIGFPPTGFSLQWYDKFVQDPKWRTATTNTIVIGIMSAILATVVGTFAAIGLQRIANKLLRDVVFGIFLMPLVVPFMVLAMALYPIFAQFGLLNSQLGVALAQGIVSVPYVLISVTSAMRRRDSDLVSACRTLGAGPWQALLHVRLRLLLPGIVGGAVLAFMTTFDDVIMPLFMGGSNVSTLPRVMVDSLYNLSDPTVMAVSATISGVALLLVIVWIAAGRSQATTTQFK